MEKSKTDKKEHILDVAERVFAELGYEGASTRLLAKEANVNMAMLNYYFGSKDGLLKAVLDRRVLGLSQALSEVISQDISIWDKLFLAVDLYTNRVTTNNCFHKIIYRELSLMQRSEVTDFIVEGIYTNVKTIKEIIEEGIKNGIFRKVDVELTVASIFGTKYYIGNSGLIASRMLNKNLQDSNVLENEIRPRLKKHLHDLLKAHLTKHDTAS